jgi:anti-anti-sigma factor
VTDLVQVHVSERDGVVIAGLTGELDVAGADRTGRQISEAVPTSATGLVVDFTDLDFIDSSGVAMMFSIARRLSSRRQQLRCVAPMGSPVARVLGIVDFERVAPVDPDLESALAAIADES